MWTTTARVKEELLGQIERLTTETAARTSEIGELQAFAKKVRVSHAQHTMSQSDEVEIQVEDELSVTQSQLETRVADVSRVGGELEATREEVARWQSLYKDSAATLQAERFARMHCGYCDCSL
jgi:hypothetical protein